MCKKYFFYDLEFASCKEDETKICEFGYVLTNEKFDIIDRGNLIINPKIQRNEWDWYVVKSVLTRKIADYEKGQIFSLVYPKIKEYLLSSNYVFGHSLSGDAKALNEEIKRYKLPSIDYNFLDVKEIYKIYSNINEDKSVSKLVSEFNIIGDENIHDAEADALNTMLILKEMLNKWGISFDEMLNKSKDIIDGSENGLIKSIEILKDRKEKEFLDTLNGDGTNEIKPYGINKNRLFEFIDNVKPNKKGTALINKKIGISWIYEKHHFNQLLNLIQIIVNEGGKYSYNSQDCNMFVKFKDNSEDKDFNYFRVKDQINEGKYIKFYEFNEFLKLLGITEKDLNSMPNVSFDFLLSKNAIITNKKEKKIIERYLNKKI